MSKSHITDFITPLGTQGNILNPMSWWGMILGTVFLLATFSLGQKVGNAVGGKVPLLSTHPQQPFSPMPTASPANTTEYIG